MRKNLSHRKFHRENLLPLSATSIAIQQLHPLSFNNSLKPLQEAPGFIKTNFPAERKVEENYDEEQKRRNGKNEKLFVVKNT